MRVAVIYSSKHGTTEMVAGAVADKMKGENNEVELFSLNKNPNPEISGFEVVILGTPVYAGAASGKMKAFCKKNESALLQKKTGLFVCGMEPAQAKQEKELKEAYSEVLLEKAGATGFLGGAFLFEKMSFIERAIIKKIAKTDKSIQRIDWDVLDAFVETLYL
jgi:menaquinone-dependent protoporphyrinogen oxidase